MPFTPFHFGPGAALHAMAPRQLSFLSFCAANIAIDTESLYNLSMHRYPVHAALHTYVGATVVIITIAILFVAFRSFATHFRVPNVLHWQNLSLRQVLTGALFGAYSHVVLDSVMHADIRPLAPFSSANALLGAVSLNALHMACAALGLLGVIVLTLRQFMTGKRSAD